METRLADLEQRFKVLEQKKIPVYDSWFHSTFSFEPPHNHNIINLTALVLGSIFAGYTATAMDEEFLQRFHTWPVQLLIFSFLSFSTLSHPITEGKLKFVLLDAAFALIVFRLLQWAINYKSKKKQKK